MGKYILPFILFFSIISCKPEVYTPKPRGYFNITLPKHSYQLFDSSSYPYKFEYPVYGNILPDPSFFGSKPENPYWINIDFPKIGGKIYFSYKPVNSSYPLYKLKEDVYKMTYAAHTKKAGYIHDHEINDPRRKVYGNLYYVTGDAASAYQFYATDSSQHFIRGALYFDTAPNADSLMPAYKFLAEDIYHLLETLQWK